MSAKKNETQSYSVQHVSALFRAIRASQLGKFTFLTYGPGLNFDYHLKDNREINLVGFENSNQDYKLQAHFQLGIGIRMTEQVIFLPQIEIPLMEAYPSGKWQAAHNFAENQLYPLLFQFKIILLRKDLMNCNAPTIPKGY